MIKPLRLLVLSGVVAGVGYGAYQCLLTPEAKANLKTTVTRAMDLTKSMSQKLNNSDQARQEATKLEANRAWIAQQWEQAGY